MARPTTTPGPASGAGAATARIERRIYGGYMAVQALAGLALWIAIATSDTVRSWFELSSDRPEVTDAFFLADMVVVVGSALSAWAIWSGRSWAPAAAGFTLGGVVYPTVYLIGWTSFTEGVGVVALGVMLGVSVCTAWVLVETCRLARAG